MKGLKPCVTQNTLKKKERKKKKNINPNLIELFPQVNHTCDSCMSNVIQYIVK